MARKAMEAAPPKTPDTQESLERLTAEPNAEAPSAGRGWRGNPEGHAEAGRKGGAKIAQDRQHMAEIGRKGGSKVASDREHMAEIGRRGGAKVSQNREHMAAIGRKGGEHR